MWYLVTSVIRWWNSVVTNISFSINTWELVWTQTLAHYWKRLLTIRLLMGQACPQLTGTISTKCILCLMSLIHPSYRKFQIQDSYVEANSIAKGTPYTRVFIVTNQAQLLTSSTERDIYINIQDLPTAPTYPVERNHSLSLSRRPGKFSFLPVSFPVPGLSFIVKTHLHIQEGREKQGELS